MDPAIRRPGTGPDHAIARFIAVDRSPFFTLTRRNLAFNRKFAVNGFINGQALPPVKDMRYGIVDIARAGCGVIAVYNALLLLDSPNDFCDVIAWGDKKAAAAFGLLGTLPWKAKRLFQRLGYAVTAVTDKSLFDRHAQCADVCLFTYWNQKGSIRQGMHTVCLQYRSNTIEVYNLYNSYAGVSRKTSLEEWTASGIQPIVLYCVHKQIGNCVNPVSVP